MSKKSKVSPAKASIAKKQFTFPAHGISIEAESMEEALKKLNSHLTPSQDV